MIRLVFAVALAGALTGCGLIDPDITDFDLSLPPKDFEVNTESWELTSDATFPAIDCSTEPGVCSAGASMLCTGANCFASCGDNDTCEVLVQVDLRKAVNLAVEKPELAKIEGQPIVSVSIERIWFDIVVNTMNVDAPEMAVYVAPINVLSSGSPQALEVGKIPAINAGETLMDGELDLTPEGEEHLKTFMKDYQTPFNIIVGGVEVVQAGDPVPMGLFKAVVNASATAGI